MISCIESTLVYRCWSLTWVETFHFDGQIIGKNMELILLCGFELSSFAYQTIMTDRGTASLVMAFSQNRWFCP